MWFYFELHIDPANTNIISSFFLRMIYACLTPFNCKQWYDMIVVANLKNFFIVYTSESVVVEVCLNQPIKWSTWFGVNLVLALQTLSWLFSRLALVGVMQRQPIECLVERDYRKIVKRDESTIPPTFNQYSMNAVDLQNKISNILTFLLQLQRS